MTAAHVTPAAGDDTGGVAADAPAATVRPDGTSRAVWDALTANPGATVAVIATRAGIGRSTTARILTGFEKNGRATRTPGGRDHGKRIPDTWRSARSAAPASTGDAPPAGAASASPETPGTDETTITTADGTGTRRAAGTDAADPSAMDASAVAGARDALTALGEAISTALTALDAGDREAALAAADTVYAGSGKTCRRIRGAVHGRPRGARGPARSHHGELRAKIAAHLTAYPGTEFTPHEISKAIGHSAGAIANALDRLVSLNEAELTCERPRRYRATTPQNHATDAPAARTTTP